MEYKNEKIKFCWDSVVTEVKGDRKVEALMVKNVKTNDKKQVFSLIKNKIKEFSDVDILVDLVSLPTDTDKNYCVQIKPDQSLDDNGIEISIPITTKNGVKHYIKNILPLIAK